MNPLLSIQILRALAALSVVYGHVVHEVGLLAQRAGGQFALPLQGLSTAGVDLFFAISGAVMVISSQRYFAAPGGARAFLRRRIARIVPIYWAVTTLFILVMMLAPGALNSAALPLVDIVKSYLFIPFERVPGAPAQPVYSLGWTLNYEMFFYALFALVLPLRARTAVVAIVVGLCAIVLVGTWVTLPFVPLRFWSDPIVLEFALGAAIGGLYLAGLRLPVWLGGMVIAAGVAGFAWANWDGAVPGGFGRLLRFGLPLAMVLAGAALMVPPKASRHSGVLAALGDASYALYLFHPFVVRALAILWGRLALPAGWVFVIVALVASSLAALVIFRWFERPLTRWLQGAAPAR